MLEATQAPRRRWLTDGWTGKPDGPPRLAGGRLCLDFANTVGHRATDHPEEFLTSYAVLVAWAWYTGAIDDAGADRLRQAAARHPEQAVAVHQMALAFRDLIYRLFVTVARGDDPEPVDLAELSRVYRHALDRAQLHRHGEQFAWDWPAGDDCLDRPLWPIAWSAVDLLTTGELDRIKICLGGDGHSCLWVFFDATKNRIRRWCSMENCGSSAKARRQTARRRQSRSQGGEKSRGTD